MDSKVILRLIGSIYDAALDPDLWDVFLASFSAHFKGNAGLFSQNITSNEVGLVKYGEADLAYAKLYQDYYAHVNPWYRNIWSGGVNPSNQEGRLFFGSGLVDPRELERTEFYADWLRPQGIYETLATPVLVSGAGITNLTILRSRRHAAFEPHEVEAWRELLPHIRRAVQVHEKLHHADAHYRSALSAFDHLKTGVILVREDGWIIFANASAESILSAGHGLSTRFGRICALSSKDTEALLHAIKEAASTGMGRNTHAGTTLALPFGQSQALSVMVSPMTTEQHLELRHGPAAMLLVEHPLTRNPDATTELARRYGLTGAQTRLLEAILNGRKLADYADEARLSINTVKSHMKQIFEKTGENRQADLIRHFLRGSGDATRKS